MLTVETKDLLNKLYNYRSKDSKILEKMNQERSTAVETQERTKKEKEILLKEIDRLAIEETSLASQGEKLTEVLEKINKDDFLNVLTRLKIDFNPDEIINKIDNDLPKIIDDTFNAKKEASQRLDNVDIEMSNAVMKVEELSIREDEALSNQNKLNQYFDMVLNGNINITRDELTNLLEKFDFTEEEQREAAKLLMFPEDGLFEYDLAIKNGEIKPNQLLNNEKESHAHEDTKTNVVEEVEEDIPEDVKESLEGNERITNIFDRIIDENVEVNNLEDVDKTEAVKESTLEEKKEETENKEVSEVEKFESLLKQLDIDKSLFTAGDYKKLLENYDEDTLTKNIETLKNNNVDFDVVYEHVELLYDKELKEKVDKLLEIGKEPGDISLVPDVLVKYDLTGLNNTINVLQISGLDPRRVPLAAY